MPKAHLTDISVQRLRAEGTYFDDTTPAFGIRIGHYPAVSLSEARKAARILLSGPEMVISRLTFEAAYEKFKEAHLIHKRHRTQRDYKRIIEKHLIAKRN